MTVEFAPLAVVKSFAERKQLTTIKEWTDASKKEDWPKYIPKRPEAIYSCKWSEILAPKPENRNNFLSYEEASYILSNMDDVNTMKDFRLMGREGRRPSNIPSNPERQYKENWNGWPAFLNGEK